MAVDNGDSGRTIRTTVFDSSDGVRTTSFALGYGPNAAKSIDGRLWFVSADGLSVVDPAHLPFNALPPPVHVESVTADRQTYDISAPGNGRLRLGARIRDLAIEYTATSLGVPEKVLFRYRLEGLKRAFAL